MNCVKKAFQLKTQIPLMLEHVRLTCLKSHTVPLPTNNTTFFLFSERPWEPVYARLSPQSFLSGEAGVKDASSVNRLINTTVCKESKCVSLIVLLEKWLCAHLLHHHLRCLIFGMQSHLLSPLHPPTPHPSLQLPSCRQAKTPWIKSIIWS